MTNTFGDRQRGRGGGLGIPRVCPAGCGRPEWDRGLATGGTTATYLNRLRCQRQRGRGLAVGSAAARGPVAAGSKARRARSRTGPDLPSPFVNPNRLIGRRVVASAPACGYPVRRSRGRV